MDVRETPIFEARRRRSASARSTTPVVLYAGPRHALPPRSLALVFGDSAELRFAHTPREIVRGLEGSPPDVIIVDRRIALDSVGLVEWLRAHVELAFCRVAVVTERRTLVDGVDTLARAHYEAGADLVIDGAGGRFDVLRWLTVLVPGWTDRA